MISIMICINLCINYDKVLDIKKDITNAILKKRSESNGVFNWKFQTILCHWQYRHKNWHTYRKTSTSWDSNGSISTRRHRLNVPLYEDINVSEPAKKSLKATGSYFAETSEDRLQYYRTCDLVWFLLKTLCASMRSNVNADVWQNLC